MPEQVRAASVRDEDHVHLMRAANGQRRRLVRDFLSSKEGNLQNITVDYNLYEKLARNPEHRFRCEVCENYKNSALLCFEENMCEHCSTACAK